MADFGSIREGVNVNIQRSDGRVHQAVVTQVHPGSSSVSVEWSERNETKGKEIELEAIYALNSALFAPKNSRVAAAAGTNSIDNGATINGHTNGQANGSRRPVHRQTQGPGTVLQQPVPQTSRNTVASSDFYPNSESMDDKRNKKANNNNNNNDEMRRKSNVVKEIEKIKKNREQRRATQEEKRQKLNEIDTSVPAWEFANMITEFRASLDFTRLTNTEPVQDMRICVCVRKRPINKKEISKKDIDVITMPNKDLCLVHLPKCKVDLTKYLDNQKFRFDFAFDESTSNDLVYRYTAQPLVNNIFQGGNAMCFAYGQTGSGKTFTMGGDFSQKNVDCSKGIYALTARDVFKQVNGKFKGQLEVYCTFFEIYCGKVYDLLNNKKKLRVLEDHKNQVQVVDLREQILSSVEDVLGCIQYGMNIRTSGTTSANAHSSRSHAVFQIILRNKSKKEHGKVSLIDLAGSERGKDTSSSDRITRMEGAEINKSLLALKECIRALGRRDAHVPFRGSTLTKVLRDSFIGEHSKVCMIAMISPGNSDVEHTLNTLRYADRVKELGTDEVNLKENTEEEEEYRLKYSDGNEEEEEEEYEGEDDVSHAMNDLQETLAELQDMEEQVLESHGDLIRDNHKWTTEYERIYEETIKVVDYDREEYATRLDNVINHNLNMLINLQKKLALFKEGMLKEEKISKTIQNPKFRKN
ncbi:kinesin KIF2A isoform X2 [Brachionus plicatilis]|uniref:Kinesin-like protein n=1 Tax=Brachionus plicatilis TaxID=10195 RepID=A0A3M7RYZ9_BRAPC|nr:kinesin KIF2A isoform X2 [Brachionus plicatilis]